MSLTNTRAAIKAMFTTAAVPVEAQFSAMIDAFPMIYTTTVSLVANTDLAVIHGNAEEAKIVQVKDSNGKNIPVNWRVDSGSTTEVILNSAKAYTNVTVSILT